MVNQVNDELIDLKNWANKNTIPKNENSDKVINIVEKIFDFSKQQKSKALKILTPK